MSTFILHRSVWATQRPGVCECPRSRVPGTPVWRLITRERAAAAEALARSGPTRARGTRVVARLARAVMGKGLDLDAWIAKVRARPCAVVRLRVDAASKRPLRASFSSTRPDLRRSRRGSANAPRVARARAVARRRRASALSRNARTSNRERVSLTLHASRALPSSPVFTFSQISDRNRKRRRSSVASRWRRASSSLCAGTSRKCSWRRATCSRCVRP